MSSENLRSLRPEFPIPDELDAAIELLEDRLFTDLDELRREEPSETALLGERVAYAIAYGRAKSDSEVIATLHKERNILQEQQQA